MSTGRDGPPPAEDSGANDPTPPRPATVPSGTPGAAAPGAEPHADLGEYDDRTDETVVGVDAGHVDAPIDNPEQPPVDHPEAPPVDELPVSRPPSEEITAALPRRRTGSTAAALRRSFGPTPRPRPHPASRVSRHLGYEVIVTLFGTLVAIVAAYVSLYGEFQDMYIKLRAGVVGAATHAPVSDEVTLITIGKEAFYNWNPEDPEPTVTPRAMLGRLVEFASRGGASVIVLDHLLDVPAEGDDVLAVAAALHPAVIAAEKYEITEPKNDVAFAPGVAPSLGDGIAAGFANLEEASLSLFSGEVIARRTPLTRSVARARLEGRWPDNLGGERSDSDVVPAMALLAAWTHRARQRDPTARPEGLFRLLHDQCADPASGCDLGVELGLPPLPVSLREHLDINFRGPEGRDGIPVIRAARVLTHLATIEVVLDQLGGDRSSIDDLGLSWVPEDMAPYIDGRVVVIGRVDAAAEDRFVTPFGFPMLARNDMAGVRIQAQIIDTLLSGRHIRHVSWMVGGLLGVFLGLAVWWSNRWTPREDLHTVAWLVAFAGLTAATVALFELTDGLVFDLGLPLTGGLFTLTAVRLWSWAREGA